MTTSAGGAKNRSDVVALSDWDYDADAADLFEERLESWLEDLDEGRVREAFVASQLDDLRALGLAAREAVEHFDVLIVGAGNASGMGRHPGLFQGP